MSGLGQKGGGGYGMGGSGKRRYGKGGSDKMEWGYNGMGDPVQENYLGMGRPS